MEEKRMPLLGDQFPKFTAQTTHGKLDIPQQFDGKWFVLFSHPADFTPVCTTEFVAFQKRYDQFRTLDCELIGLSVDQVFSHIKWIQWIKEKLDIDIEYPVIADTGAVAETLGLIHPGKGSNTVRAVFIVDPKGVLRSLLYYPQELGRNIDEVVRMVKGLQISDKEGVALAAGWPENELIGDAWIIPPASDMKSASERLNKYEGFDWWFCYRKI